MAGIKRRSKDGAVSLARLKRSKPSTILDYLKPQPRSQKQSHFKSKDGNMGAANTKEDDIPSQEDSNGPNNITVPIFSTPDDDTPDDVTRVTLTESTGHVFAAPRNSLLIHACNCVGSWGGGIAIPFKSRYRGAFKFYNLHCRESGPTLLGTALLIPPQASEAKKAHFIGCLFTSVSVGNKVDSPRQILNATGPAMKSLMQQVADWNQQNPHQQIGEVRMCKINSGLFNVAWTDTKAELEKVEVIEGGFNAVAVIERTRGDDHVGLD